MQYLVTWEIEIEAMSCREAACQALFIQRDPHSIATVFKVKGASGKTIIVDFLKNKEISQEQRKANIVLAMDSPADVLRNTGVLPSFNKK